MCKLVYIRGRRMFRSKFFNHSVCLSCFIRRVQMPWSNKFLDPSESIDRITEVRRLICVSKHNPSKIKSERYDMVTKDFFDNVGNKNKQNYLDMVRIFEGRGAHRRGHVEFIYAALRHMEEFGVHKDLEAYKRLIDVFPKGKFIPTNMFQAEFMHYPKQQQCAIDLLDKMEENGVIPDAEVEDILLNIFGKSGHPLRKYWRMMYWMPKFKNLNPWPLPNPVPNDNLELAKLALKQMISVDLQTSIIEYKTSDVKDSIDDTWIVSAQSPTQMELLDAHPEGRPIFVEGAFRVWLRNKSVNYFILRADPLPLPNNGNKDTHPDDVSGLKTPFEESMDSALQLVPSVHEQEEGTVLAMCATGTSSRDSLLSWIRLLQESNPRLSKIPILFSLRSPFGQVVPIQDSEENPLSSVTVLDK